MEKHSADFTNKENNKLTPFITLILSKHLYISFFIFFFPYLLKLFTYLFPLLVTTSLLLLALLVPLDSIVNSKDGFFATSYTTLSEILHPKDGDGDGILQPIEVFEAYKIVFETPSFLRMEENQDDINEFDVQHDSDVSGKEKKLEPQFGDNVSKEERMDMLWETYETEEVKEGKNGGEVKELMVISDSDKVDYGDNDESSENGKLCCLKALKLSAGKMNLSMGRSSLVKFGKAFKGIGWLKKHGRRKHTKKGKY